MNPKSVTSARTLPSNKLHYLTGAWLLRITIQMSLCFLAIFVMGCAAAYFVTHSTSPDGKYGAYANVRGAMGRSFFDETEKQLRVGVSLLYKSNPSEFHQTFHTVGSDVTWDGTWDEHDNLEMVFYDYGLHVTNAIMKSPGIPKRYLCTITFDSSTGRFQQKLEKKVIQ